MSPALGPSAASGPSSSGPHLVLYDGPCGLCNRATRLVLRHDVEGRFHFAALQTPFAQAFLHCFGRDADTMDTFYVVTDYQSESPTLLAKSRAAQFVAAELRGEDRRGAKLGGLWRWARLLEGLPRTWLDFGYDAIARRRYRFFGHSDACPMPGEHERGRFVGGGPGSAVESRSGRAARP